MEELFSRETAEAYDSFYETAAGLAIDGLEKRSVDYFLADLPKVPMLELGCGTGHWTEHFFKRGFSVTATDMSEYMLAIARGKNIEGARFLRMDAESLAFTDGAFSLITAVTLFEFLENPDAAISEMCRVLAPGGWFIGGFLNADSELGKNEDFDPVVNRGRLFTVRELEERLACIGPVELRTCVRFSKDLTPMDGTPEAEKWAPAFLAVRAKKKG